ncbi:MAG: DUF4440 domain-containing protein [Burkholderiales bacterium PBB4]|nr:MAG: DUF4440 domain-containing protein [Burkholderiales bacterium PBB4]
MQPSTSPAVQEVLAAYRNAVYAQDVAAFMQLYTTDARVFDTWQVWSYEGSAQRHPTIVEWFTSLGTERVKVDFEDVQVTQSPELAVLSAITTFAAISKQGAVLRSMQNRLTWGLKFVDGAWRIAHEHTSTPIGFADQKALFQRNAENPATS